MRRVIIKGETAQLWVSSSCKCKCRCWFSCHVIFASILPSPPSLCVGTHMMNFFFLFLSVFGQHEAVVCLPLPADKQNSEQKRGGSLFTVQSWLMTSPIDFPERTSRCCTKGGSMPLLPSSRSIALLHSAEEMWTGLPRVHCNVRRDGLKKASCS